jgi:hypothetical protein
MDGDMCKRYRPYRRLFICSSLQGFLGWRKAKFPNRYLEVEENNLHGQGEGDAESIPPFSYVRSAMTRARQELVPNIPWEVGDVEIEGTWAGDYFLLE